MTFWEHLEVLRGVIFRSLIAVIILMIVAIAFKSILFDVIILAPKRPDFITYRLLCKVGTLLGITSLCDPMPELKLININLAGQFMSHMTIGMIAGVILASPYIIWELWRFIMPGLTERERKNTRGAVLIITLLFILGILFSFFIVVPLMVNFLGSYQVSSSVTNTIALNSYTSSVTTMTLLMGLIFEFPVVVLFLTKVGIINPSYLTKYRRHTIVVILIVAGIITPSPDIFSQIVVALPLYGLFEISVLISKRIYRKRAESAEE